MCVVFKYVHCSLLMPLNVLLGGLFMCNKLFLGHASRNRVDKGRWQPAPDIYGSHHKDIGSVVALLVLGRPVNKCNHVHERTYFATLMRVLGVVGQALLEDADIALLGEVSPDRVQEVKVTIRGDKRSWRFEIKRLPFHCAIFV